MNMTRLFMILVPLLLAFFGASCLSIALYLLITRDPAKGKFFRLGLRSIAAAILMVLLFLIF